MDAARLYQSRTTITLALICSWLAACTVLSAPATPAATTRDSPVFPTAAPGGISNETDEPAGPGDSPTLPGAPGGEGDLPYAPQAADAALTRGEAFLDPAATDILVLESFPPQFRLNLEGDLPTPCHALRIEVAPSTSQKRIDVTVYSVVDPGAICVQVLSPFSATVQLNQTSTTAGTYDVFLNGAPAGQIVLH